MQLEGSVVAMATMVVAVVSVGGPVGSARADGTLVIRQTSAEEGVPGAVEVGVDTAPAPAFAGADGDVIPQMPGFPVQMGTQFNFKPARGLVFANLVGDERLEIVTSSTDSRMYAWDVEGAALPGFPVTTIGWCQYAPSVGDLDGDGDLEIVQCTRGLTNGGRLYAVDHLGQTLPGFPINVNNNNVASCPTLFDLDGDDRLEIIVAERAGTVGFLRVFRVDGSEWGADGSVWPVALDHVPTGTVAVADVDADGAPEIFAMSYQSMYLLETDGTALAGWPRQIQNARFSYQSAALADLDGDDDLEIVVGAHRDAAGCYVFHHDGTGYPGWPRFTDTWTFCPPTVTDLDGDGALEIIDGRAGSVSIASACFWVWSTAGVPRGGFPYVRAEGGGSEGPLVAADIDGDGMKEIFADYNKMTSADSRGFLFGVDAAGNDLPGFPLRPRGFTYLNGATIGDVDGDGDYELGVLSYVDFEVDVNLYDLPDRYGVACVDDWPVYHARNERGGRFESGCDACPADLDASGAVDFGDILAILTAWGPCPECPEDLDGDGEAAFSDILVVLASWGPCG